MANKHDLVKEQWWRQALERWQRGGLSVRAFCDDEGVGEHTFYWWRRELRRRDGRPRRPQKQTRNDHFVPVQIVADPVIDIVLPSQRVLRVPRGFDPEALRQILAILEEKSC
jgi:transposase-like protein